MDIGSEESATGLLVWAILAVLVMTLMLSVLAGMVMDVDLVGGITGHIFGNDV